MSFVVFPAWVRRLENRAVSSQGVCTPGGENCSSERRFGRIVLPGEEGVKGNRKAPLAGFFLVPKKKRVRILGPVGPIFDCS